MCKSLTRKAMLAAAASAVVLSSCGLVDDWIKPQTQASAVTQTTTDNRIIETTKTAVYNAEGDDEDYQEYTSSTSLTGGTLENDYSRPDLYDENVRATTTTTAKTYYTISGEGVTVSDESSEEQASTSKTTVKTTAAQTTTEFTADALFPLTQDMEYSSAKSFTVKSDTTYLNLRFGPSKDYDVQLKIPDGEKLYGLGQTQDESENVWVYVTYNGTGGWVMGKLLTED